VDEALENIEDGVKVGGHLVNAVRFADDQTMVANSKAGLQRIINEQNDIRQNDIVTWNENQHQDQQERSKVNED